MKFTLGFFYERLREYFNENKGFYEFIDTIELKKNDKFLDYGEKQSEFAILIHGKLISKYEYEFDNKYDSEEFVSKIFYADIDQEENIPFIINHESYFFNKASTEVIQAIENSTIVVIKKELIDKVIETDLSLKKIFSDFEECSFLDLTERLRDLQSLSQEHKLKKFFRQNPELKSLKVKYIIQYLGIRSRDSYYRVLRKLRK
jgi:hypothetical protein